MKKLFLYALAFILMILPLSALAEQSYVFDEAGVLTAEEKASLEAEAKACEKYECGVYIAVVDEIMLSDVATLAMDFYEEHNLGYGEAKDGVMLLLNMDERDYSLIAYGAFGNSAFTDYGKDALDDAFLDDFANDDWYSGFVDYLSKSGEMLALARDGAPLDTAPALPINEYPSSGTPSSNEPMSFIDLISKMFVSGIIPGVIISAIICLVLWGSLKTARKSGDAMSYITDNKITLKTDRYTHSTVVRTKIESSSSSKGGTSVNSRGFSSRSGKF